eukprot:TRINITY_DN10796_c0_g1_i1.p2 TRINITY_DN10796_c0_g1~~TRINITY_DN10796_c0_g1_i1.p2  ORF type:complete len:279 (+),score=81.48 TRINITY_DN10796_c0_g1_i1:48-884(+)
MGRTKVRAAPAPVSAAARVERQQQTRSVKVYEEEAWDENGVQEAGCGGWQSGLHTYDINLDPEATEHKGGLYWSLKPVLPAATCEKLKAKCATFTDWCQFDDTVDRKKEWQHCILDVGRGICDETLLPLCAAMADDVLLPQVQKVFGMCPKKVKMHWAFIRKYHPSGRTDFPCHRDTSAITANILLSRPEDYEGAELYLLPNELGNVDVLSPQQFKKVLPEATLRSEHALHTPARGRGAAVPPAQGECCFHFGRRMHGVLPIQSGVRYTLILMFVDNL